MWIQQVFVACLCVLLGLQQITAVVNNGQKAFELSTTNNITNSGTNSSNSSDSSSRTTDISGVADSVAESSEQKTNRREAPLGLSNSYGVPVLSNTYAIPLEDSYIPSLPSNIGLPVPVYGVPDAPTNNIVYPAPPADIPPPVQNLPIVYGPPKDNFRLPVISLPPPKYALPEISSYPLKSFNLPLFNIPKPVYGSPPSFGSPPRPQYGPPPKPVYIPPKLPKPSYGPPIKLPKPHYGPPKPLYVPSKPLGTYGPPTGYLNPPIEVYGPPKNIYVPPKGLYRPQPAPTVQYGPPEPVPHGPPHPGAPAPPTPPDIKYDGWQPIPGLVSRPPSGTYGVPRGQSQGINDLHFNTDFVPPPSGGQGSGQSGSYKGSSGFSDSYGAPLNTVTGSGGVVSTSGDAHRGAGGVSAGLSSASSSSSSSFGIGGSVGHEGGGLSVIKSIGYEILPTSGNIAGIQNFAHGGLLADSYSSPPLNSYSPNGPYAAAHSYDVNGISSLSTLDGFASSLASSFETTLLGSSDGFGHGLSSGIGLIPPSGIYGVPPSGKYGTPLLHPPNKHNGPGLNINPPKHPVVFREPVPPGLIESIGNSVAQKDAHGIIESGNFNNFAGPTYVPPPIPDVTKPVKEEEPTGPSTLYSLPSKNPTSFQNYVEGSSSAGLGNNFAGSFNFNGATAEALTSHTAPLGTVDGSYALPQTSGLAIGLTSPQTASENLAANSFGSAHAFAASNNFASSNFASNNFASSLSGSYGNPYFASYQGAGHDCSQNSQPVPSLSFGVPAANSYTASLASLNTNTAGAYHGPPPSLGYGVTDLQAAHSQSTSSVSDASYNSLEEDKQQAEVTGKSLAENFGPGSELIKSQSIDLNNIPLQGALGSYTLQIQSADGSGRATNIPHDQVLNDGLLQSILNAIEQPQQNTAAILRQPLLHLQQIPPQIQPNGQFSGVQHVVPSGSGQFYGTLQDSEAQHSGTKNIIVTPPPLQTTVGVTKVPESAVTDQPEDDKEANLPLIDNNEIALYFSNNAESANIPGGVDDSTQQNKNAESSNVRNGQQYGSYVSFKTPNSSFVYGDLRPLNGTLEDDAKTVKAKT